MVGLGMVFGVGWVAATRFQSPAQREANAAPPAAQAIFADVVTGELADRVGGSGRIAASTTSPIVPTSLPENAVVTGDVAEQGASIGEGSVVTEVNGRPLFVFSGQFAFYRDLAPGAKGPDVNQLQTGLIAAGFLGSRGVTGIVDEPTVKAIDALYSRHGYESPGQAPLSEITVVTELPSTLTSTMAVGTHPEAGAPVAELSRGDLVAKVDVSSDAVLRIRTGMRASLTVRGTKKELAGVVRKVVEADAEATTSQVIIATNRPLNARLGGKIAVGVITVQQVAGPALLVPVRALVKTSDVQAHLLVSRGDGPLRKVDVEVLGELAGQAAVRPTAGRIREGDQVKVG